MGSVSDGTPAVAGASRAGVTPTDRQGHRDQGFVLEAPVTGKVVHTSVRPRRASQRSPLVSGAVQEGSGSHGQVSAATCRRQSEEKGGAAAGRRATRTIDGERTNQRAGLGRGRNFPILPSPVSGTSQSRDPVAGSRTSKSCRILKIGKIPPEKLGGQVP